VNEWMVSIVGFHIVYEVFVIQFIWTFKTRFE